MIRTYRLGASAASGVAAALIALSLPVPAFAQMGPGGFGPGGGSGGQNTKKQEGDILPEVDPKIANDPKAVFAHAEKAYADHEWLEAIAYYQHIRTKFSYNVGLSALAELRLGDVAYGREHWAEAKVYYKNFLKLHPRHEKADYAAFQLGLCAYKDIPTSWFIEPPADQRDQSEVHTALNVMGDFVRDYPLSAHVEEARKIVLSCEEKLADHEIYVAKFYVSRGKWAGVVLRAEGLAATYPDSKHVPEALVMAIDANIRLAADATDPTVRNDRIGKARNDFARLSTMGFGERWVSKGKSALGKYM